MDLQLEAAYPRRLLAAPAAFADESRASWIQRLCGAHGYSTTRLRRIIGIASDLPDWDVNVPAPAWTSLLDMAGVQQRSCGQAMAGLDVLTKQFTASSVLLGAKRKPQYRWCSLCFAQDHVPYLRWEWRLTDLKHCCSHKAPLLERCPWCGSAMFMHRALLVGAGSQSGVPDLASCGTCGMSLKDSGYDENEEIDPPQLSDSQLLLDDLLCQLRGRHLCVDPQMTFDFSEYGGATPNAQLKITPRKFERNNARRDDPASGNATPESFPSNQTDDEPVDFDCLVSRIRNLAKYPLYINGDTFTEGFEFPGLKPEKKKWSHFLSERSRAKVSRALRIVRKELRTMGLRHGGAQGSPAASSSGGTV